MLLRFPQGNCNYGEIDIDIGNIFLCSLMRNDVVRKRSNSVLASARNDVVFIETQTQKRTQYAFFFGGEPSEICCFAPSCLTTASRACSTRLRTSIAKNGYQPFFMYRKLRILSRATLVSFSFGQNAMRVKRHASFLTLAALTGFESPRIKKAKQNETSLRTSHFVLVSHRRFEPRTT